MSLSPHSRPAVAVVFGFGRYGTAYIPGAAAAGPARPVQRKRSPVRTAGPADGFAWTDVNGFLIFLFFS